MSGQQILEVSQINNYIKEILDTDVVLNSVCIRGELSNYKKYPSGHHYFTLKDSQSALKCVMFRSNAMRLRFRPENGMNVLVAGRISVYPRDGAYQLYAVSMMPEGAGDLSIAFQQLKAKLEKEGLFDEAHKKPLPKIPHRIAIVTSSAGAAVHDMLRVIGHRYPLSDIYLVPVRVQGEEAAGEIAAAIRFINRIHGADIIITGRGGGSMEDLWAFNEEIVARAIYASEIPVISAVGHEPDVTISDYVADLRAATPSNAGELAVPDQADLRRKIDMMRASMAQSMSKRLKLSRQRLNADLESRAFRDPHRYFEEYNIRLDRSSERLAKAMDKTIHDAKQREQLQTMQLFTAYQKYLGVRRRESERLIAGLDAMSPLKVLSRGYSMTLSPSGTAVRSAHELSVGDNIRVRFREGAASAVVTEVQEEMK